MVMKPLSKALKLIRFLHGPTARTTQDISRHLEIHRRSVYRYIGALEDAGVPVIVEQCGKGRHTTYRVPYGWRL